MRLTERPARMSDNKQENEMRYEFGEPNNVRVQPRSAAQEKEQ